MLASHLLLPEMDQTNNTLHKKRTRRLRRITTSYRRSSRSAPEICSQAKRGQRYTPFRPLLSPPRPPPPPHPSSTLPQSNLLDILPTELKLLVVDVAVEDYERTSDSVWYDLPTLKAIMLVSRGFWHLAAPIYWRAVDLGDVPEVKLAEFSRHLSALALSHVNFVCGPTVLHETTTSCNKNAQCRFINACPRLSRLEMTVFPSIASIFDDIPTSTFDKLSEYSLLCDETIAEGFSAEPVEIGMEAATLSPLDGRKLIHLRLVGLSHAFAWSFPALTHYLSGFRALTHLYLCGIASLRAFYLADLAVDAPLQLLYLDLESQKISGDSLMWYLANYQNTLTYFSLVASITSEPRAKLHLPKLRYLRLIIPLPHLVLPHLATAPLHVLALNPCPDDSTPSAARDLHPSFASRPSLRILLTTRTFVEVLPPGGLDAVVNVCKAQGVLILWKGNGKKKVSVDVEEVEAWAKMWKEEGRDAAFMEEGYLEERELTPEYA